MVALKDQQLNQVNQDNQELLDLEILAEDLIQFQHPMLAEEEVVQEQLVQQEVLVRLALEE